MHHQDVGRQDDDDRASRLCPSRLSGKSSREEGNELQRSSLLAPFSPIHFRGLRKPGALDIR